MKKKLLKISSVVLVIIMTLTLCACFDLLPPPERAPLPTGATPKPLPGNNPDGSPSDTPTDTPTPPGVPDGTPPGAPGAPSVPGGTASSFPFPFTATDIYGRNVTEASLGELDVFFIHFWGTWCPPCIAEMHELGQLALEYSDKVGFLMLLDDIENKDAAIEIYNDHGFFDIENVVTISAWDNFDYDHEIFTMLDLQYVPTTIVIDSDGNLLEHFAGAFFDGYAHFLYDLFY